MMWTGLMVLMTVGLLTAQGTPPRRTCKCMPFYYCKSRNWIETKSCSRRIYNEVCCVQDSTPTVVTEASPTSPIPTSIPEGSKNSSTPKPRISHDVVCGVQNKEQGIGFVWKIDLPFGVEGDTDFGEFPWMTAIVRNTPEGQKFVCGGSIIYPNLILTAAHSVKDIPASELLVKTGVWNTTDVTETPVHQNRSVLQTVLHHDFNFDKMKVANDFALLVLNQSLKITDTVVPVCLPNISLPINESSCVATGWGGDKYGKSGGDILKKVFLPLVDFNTCQDKIKHSSMGRRFKLHDSFICAGNGYQGDTCVGDGGGPLMCATTANPDQYVQVGITSWGVGCSNGVPGVYSSVKAAMEWIEGQANNFPATYEK